MGSVKKCPTATSSVPITDAHTKDNMEKNINVTESVIHPSWNNVHNAQDWRNDIAILKLVEDVDLSKYTPACLPRPGENFVGKTALAMGMLFILTSHW